MKDLGWVTKKVRGVTNDYKPYYIIFGTKKNEALNVDASKMELWIGTDEI